MGRTEIEQIQYFVRCGMPRITLDFNKIGKSWELYIEEYMTDQGYKLTSEKGGIRTYTKGGENDAPGIDRV